MCVCTLFQKRDGHLELRTTIDFEGARAAHLCSWNLDYILPSLLACHRAGQQRWRPQLTIHKSEPVARMDIEREEEGAAVAQLEQAQSRLRWKIMENY